jgi:hypothetical protein
LAVNLRARAYVPDRSFAVFTAKRTKVPRADRSRVDQIVGVIPDVGFGASDFGGSTFVSGREPDATGEARDRLLARRRAGQAPAIKRR